MKAGWTEVALGEVAKFVNGAAFKESEWGGSAYPIIRIQNLTDRTKPFNWTDQVVRPDLHVIPGDLLVSWSGTLGVFRWNGPHALLNQHIFRVTPVGQLIETDYLHRLLVSVIQSLERHAHGATMKHLTKPVLLNTKVVLPPLGEQRRIAAILDQADELRAKRRQAIAHLDSLTEAIFLDMFGDPVTNPMGWDVVRTRDVADIQIGPFGSLLHQADYCNGGIPVINPTHITRSGLRPSADVSVGEDVAARLAKFMLRSDDVILGRRGEMGRCAVVALADEPAICGSGSMYLRPLNERIKAQVLGRILSSRSMVGVLEREALGVTMLNLNEKIVGSLQFGLPPIDRQKAYLLASTVASRSLRSALANSSHLDELFASLQARAFAGEL